MFGNLKGLFPQKAPHNEATETEMTDPIYDSVSCWMIITDNVSLW